MRIYNKRKFFIGIGEFILSIVAFVTMFITRTIDIKFIVVNVIVFTLGIVNISRSLSKSDTAEDNDERNRLISLRINNMRYKILIVVIYISVVAGMLAYGVTRNINIVIALLPLLLLLCIWFISSFILAFYYEKKC